MVFGVNTQVYRYTRGTYYSVRTHFKIQRYRYLRVAYSSRVCRNFSIRPLYYNDIISLYNTHIITHLCIFNTINSYFIISDPRRKLFARILSFLTSRYCCSFLVGHTYIHTFVHCSKTTRGVGNLHIYHAISCIYRYIL